MDSLKISVADGGFVRCQSGFYFTHDSLAYRDFYFTAGINRLYGEIDSGVWAISYLLSMYRGKSLDFILSMPQITLDDTPVTIQDILKYSCYMDKSYPLFSTKKSVRKLVNEGIKKNGLTCTAEEIRNLFYMDEQRFERPLTGVGHEVFKAMSAIGYCHQKEIYCFPWMSQMRIQAFNKPFSDSLEILADLKKIAIVPMGNMVR